MLLVLRGNPSLLAYYNYRGAATLVGRGARGWLRLPALGVLHSQANLVAV